MSEITNLEKINLFEYIIHLIIDEYCVKKNITKDEFNEINDFSDGKIHKLLYFMCITSKNVKLTTKFRWWSHIYGIVDKDLFRHSHLFSTMKVTENQQQLKIITNIDIDTYFNIDDTLKTTISNTMKDFFNKIDVRLTHWSLVEIARSLPEYKYALSKAEAFNRSDFPITIFVDRMSDMLEWLDDSIKNNTHRLCIK